MMKTQGDPTKTQQLRCKVKKYAMAVSSTPPLHPRCYVLASSVTASVCPVFRPVPNIFLSLHKNTDWTSMKFT